ncbi:glycosyltransferase family 4 protein [Marinomonas shanghaiensis]|uniref:glycosyltransferase family 4 protein n=1 Tax=Marinomonas shanghaiensis TaxID=2202418 RepID=UPI003A92BEBE
MSNKMNVLHICLSTGFGGLEMYPMRVGATMMSQGCNVYGMGQAGTPTNARMVETFDSTLSLASRGEGYRKLFSIAQWIKQREIDVVHCHKSSDLTLAVLLKKLCGFKLIYTDHMGAKRSKRDFYHRFIYRNVDLVLSISNFTRARNVKALPMPESKIKRLWYGTEIADIEDIEFNLKAELSLPLDAILIGIVGRLSNGKGHLELLKAFKQLTISQAHLIIVGGLTAETGGSTEYVRMLQSYVAENDLQDKVTFYGFTDKPDILLKTVDIVVIPSHNEAFGLTVIEAMAAKKAVVGSSHGAIPELLEDTGVVVDPFDTEAFASAIDGLSSSVEERERLSLLARKRACDFFDQKKHVDTLLEIYRTC